MLTFVDDGPRAAQSTAPLEEQADFPVVGARARRWSRFERELETWLASPSGRFAAWRAHQAVARAHDGSPRSAR
jgi:hypothetical protein